ncbi:MAG: hypothetical protein P8M78_10435 [Myxococcota bacterium]|nr:hypothetical protein [Myxococcota bacterium]
MEKRNRECYQRDVDKFLVNADLLRAESEVARDHARAGSGAVRLGQLTTGVQLKDSLTASLLFDSAVTTAQLVASAEKARGEDQGKIETFAPLYITNECDGECKMCGMRGPNTKLLRKTASPAQVREQLEILRARHMPGVAILSGEYQHGNQRKGMLSHAAEAMRFAIKIGFSHVLINVGSLERDEYKKFFEEIERDERGAFKPHVTMCTFQETYDPSIYSRFMGSTVGNPRSDFPRRLSNFERAYEVGMRSVNPGVLLGLNPDLTAEFLALCSHIRHLDALGFSVYVSLPRLRKASGAEYRKGVSDDELTRFVALMSLQFPKAKLVISTRERPEIQRRLLPIVQVLTPGSPGVAPYTAQSAHFEVEASQFEVLDQRPFETILDEHLRDGAVIEGYNPGPG